jgi:hypothetical protein
VRVFFVISVTSLSRRNAGTGDEEEEKDKDEDVGDKLPSKLFLSLNSEMMRICQRRGINVTSDSTF